MHPGGLSKLGPCLVPGVVWCHLFKGLQEKARPQFFDHSPSGGLATPLVIPFEGKTKRTPTTRPLPRPSSSRLSPFFPRPLGGWGGPVDAAVLLPDQLRHPRVQHRASPGELGFGGGELGGTQPGQEAQGTCLGNPERARWGRYL